MKCEYCNKTIHRGETAHGFRYGAVDDYNQVFLPSRESAWTVLCSSCGEKIYRLIYSSLSNTSVDPTIYKTLTQTK